MRYKEMNEAYQVDVRASDLGKEYLGPGAENRYSVKGEVSVSGDKVRVTAAYEAHSWNEVDPLQPGVYFEVTGNIDNKLRDGYYKYNVVMLSDRDRMSFPSDKEAPRSLGDTFFWLPDPPRDMHPLFLDLKVQCLHREKYGFSGYVSREIHKEFTIYVERGSNARTRYGYTPGEQAEQSWDMERALEHLRSHARKDSIGSCGQYTREAINTGGGTPVQKAEFAGNLGPNLVAAGFVAQPAGTTPRAGDVVVIQPLGGGVPRKGHAGHAAMFDGKIWISDFRQRELYPGGGYRTAHPPYIIYRRP